MHTARKKRTANVQKSLCVACGCCAKICPLGAISIHKGILAVVDPQICVGCGKCVKECPASIIELQEVQA